MVRGDLEDKFKGKNNIYSPVAGLDCIRMIIMICLMFRLRTRQIDIKTAFLYGKRKRPIYLRIPLGHPKRNENFVWKTYTSIYGLRDAPKVWYNLLHEVLVNFGLKRCPLETCLYIKKDLLVMIYVDDILFCAKKDETLDEFERHLLKHFKLNSTDVVKKYVGFEAKNNKILAEKHIEAACKRFRLIEAKNKWVPIEYSKFMQGKDIKSKKLEDLTLFQSIVGTLHYINGLCRSDISFITNYLARRTKCATSYDLKIAKEVLCYLKATKDLGINVGQKRLINQVCVITDSDLAGDREDRKSVSAWLVYVNDTLFGFKTRKQKVIALSTFEAELIALTEGIREAIFIRNFLRFINVPVAKFIKVKCDNQSTIKGFKNFTKKTKYMEIRVLYVMDKMQNEVEVEYIESKKNPADLLTKVVKDDLFKALKTHLVM